ncbi:MAG: acetyl-CoA carboxylase biotin carboxylase subunit [Myxococcales bacterium]|nr:acetyl-CoA carboxylase biotin carboxylase subunit [Myxococcales bacterium]MCB9533965.1 acetyl-CoA carboxylase biotin carboxylase subunit [Myxococcales bacterium]
MFRKVLVANRGEIALRIIRACHAVGAKAVAVYSDADRGSPHLEEADETVCIGPGPAAASYLDADAVLQAALQTDCQALHPGYGFLAENARFARRCAQQQLAFVGPTPEAIRMMGDKASARAAMIAAKLPVMPGSKAILPDVEAARRAADELGYPVLLKATAGGGGKGMRRVDAPDALADAFADASREAAKAFGNPDLYIEKYIVGGRHIEFQVLADHYGNVVHLGERECSVQRNHQKLIEEAPASAFDPNTRAKLGEQVRAAVAAIGYRNAGTIEFLMDASGALYFMEMNTRVQVEHPVTELVTGVDIVAWQLRIAAGERLTLSQDHVEWRGHAVECRINAEDPANAFRPAPGTLTRFAAPGAVDGATVRWDSHVREGYKIPPFYDSMVGKLIVWAADRPSALAAMEQALASLRLEGVPTTIDLHRRILATDAFRAGGYTCQFLAEHPELTSH